MLAKRLLLLFPLTLLYFSGIAIDYSKRFELILKPSQAPNRSESKMVVDVYNGYELVTTAQISPNTPTHLYLNLYCNYILIIKSEGRSYLKYKISTEVPTKVEKEWKLLVQIPTTVTLNEAAFAEVREGNISYKEEVRSFNFVETKSPMAEQSIGSPNNSSQE